MHQEDKRLPGETARGGDDNPPADMIGILNLSSSLSSEWAALHEDLSRARPSQLWPVLKTLSGEWTTTYRVRVHPHKFHCMFGCPEVESNPNIDDVSHYLTCPRLWSHLCQPRGILSASVLRRIGLNGEVSHGENGSDSAIARVFLRIHRQNYLYPYPTSDTEVWAVDHQDGRGAGTGARPQPLPSRRLGAAGVHRRRGLHRGRAAARMMRFEPGDLQQYIDDHKAVWPEMQSALVACGWHNYSLFLREDGFAVGYFETDVDFKTACARMDKHGVNDRWQEAMKKYTPASVSPVDAASELKHYFYLGGDRCMVRDGTIPAPPFDAAWKPQSYTGGGGRTRAGRRRICFQMQFAPTALDQHLKEQERVSPEQQKALIECGWHNCSLFYSIAFGQLS
ncbi:unnamed protein product [Prorocentrum cordatum]|uniref:L-rhamnose mutarotase n=1 Tax=Prorocentrum cordatum TaxID=2364126 RepID=A0ABN9S638_9DINO|nr:unnamed protein product [Polarella glacialis]